ncbi:MAG: bifunctional adenosylcobinamide kinase/adenosylcobinamide-phosphate guanylyltransferase [Deltaproteobacteria bacterium]|nr:bifunctional adenosylcobinamide kinase/adenosylcobinamide-phosphate guanylyltransferase [Deltaproteobacteria bacterium]
MNEHVLILGGAKSGKTGLALSLAEAASGELVYLATAQAYDQEMVERISRHQAERGPAWCTVEEPLALVETLRRLDQPGLVVLVDCLTLWMSNLMTQADLDEEGVGARARELAEALPGLVAKVILVGNEVGLGIVPDNALARRFRDQAGALNQALARVAGRVVLVVAGLPQYLKGTAEAPAA